MFTPKLNNVLLGAVVASLFFLTLLTHLSSMCFEDDSDYESYAATPARKVMPPTLDGGSSLSIKSNIIRSERQYQEMLEERIWLKTQWEDPKNKSL